MATRRLTVLALMLAVAAIGGAQDRPSLRASRPATPIRVDGVLDDAAWSAADSIADLLTTEPREGGPPVGRTVVRVLAEHDAITIGIRADDPEPHRIVAFARDRDASLGNEDHVKLVLDTYLDGRSGYVFSINPNGARHDALVADQGEGENPNWDAIWEARTARGAHGWSAEVRIPVKSLLFKRGLTAWGFNVQRRVQRLLETSRWASPRRDYEIMQTSRSGLLTDLPRFDLGVGLTIRPSLTSGFNQPSPVNGASTNGELALDATQRVSGNTIVSLTVNTDFAETEVDTRRTNLTRFPLVFPEKRTFFLEGADIFDFGLGLTSDVRPFFSRRIGLLGGREVPLDAGLKVNGREGGTNFGALVVSTGQLDTLPADNVMTAVRLKQNVLRESAVGVISTSGDPLGRSGSWLAGPDFTYQTSRFQGDKNFLVGAWALAMNHEGLPRPQRSWGGKIDYPNDLWDIALTYKWIDSTFQPAVGFVPRPGVQMITFNVTHSPRPRRPIGPLRVRQMLNESLNTFVLDLNGEWESYRFFIAPVNWRLESGDRFEINANPTGERLVVPFEIADGVVIPAGEYHWTRHRLEYSFASKRKLSGQVTWWFGKFYTGRLDELIVTGAWKPSSLFIVELSGTRNVGDLREGRFTQQVVGTRFRMNYSADLQLNSFVQYDNETRGFGTNSRLRWTFVPGGDLFVVYNHNLTTYDAVGDRSRWAFASNQLLTKLQYALRF